MIEDEKTDTSYLILSTAIRQVILRPKLAGDLKAGDTRQKTMKMLGITEEMRTEILNILNELEQKGHLSGGEKKGLTPSKVTDDTDDIVTDKKFMLESFTQLRTAYRASMIMSCVMFFVGLAFLALAAIRTFVDPQSIAVTSVIGGIGVVQIVALFYRNPLAHIASTVSNAQQAKMAVISYLIGIAFLNQQTASGAPSDEHMKNLIELTETALGQLQKYTSGSSQEGDRQEPTVLPDTKT